MPSKMWEHWKVGGIKDDAWFHAAVWAGTIYSTEVFALLYYILPFPQQGHTSVSLIQLPMSNT